MSNDLPDQPRQDLDERVDRRLREMFPAEDVAIMAEAWRRGLIELDWDADKQDVAVMMTRSQAAVWIRARKGQS